MAYFNTPERRNARHKRALDKKRVNALYRMTRKLHVAKAALGAVYDECVAFHAATGAEVIPTSYKGSNSHAWDTVSLLLGDIETNLADLSVGDFNDLKED